MTIEGLIKYWSLIKTALIERLADEAVIISEPQPEQQKGITVTKTLTATIPDILDTIEQLISKYEKRE